MKDIETVDKWQKPAVVISTEGRNLRNINYLEIPHCVRDDKEVHLLTVSIC